MVYKTSRDFKYKVMNIKNRTNKINFIFIIYIITSIIGLILLARLCYEDKKEITTEECTPTIIIINFSDTPSPEEVKMALTYYKIKHPNIVYAQSVLETGHFKSNICKNYNNLFGLYNSNTKDFYKFDKWEDSVRYYKNYIQGRYVKGDYYAFLDSIGYAEDVNYIKKLKELVHE